MIKVCFFSFNAYGYFNPEIKIITGGAERQIYNFSVELAKDFGFEVSCIVKDFGQADFEERQKVKIFKFNEFNRSIKYLGVFLNFFRLYKLLKKIDADIYVQRAAGLETGEIALFCKLTGKRFIYMTAHDEEVGGEKPSWMKKGWDGWLRWTSFKIGLKMADIVMVQHERQKENLVKFYRKKVILRKSADIINIVDKEGDFILWSARCEGWKGPHVFLNLIKSFPQEKFVMICPPANNELFFSNIKEQAQNIANLEFIDYLPTDEYNSYFLKSKLFISTSEKEGFPNSFIEAAKNKTPILSLNVDPDGILGKYNFGRCANGDFEKLESDLKEVLSNEKIWDEMAENAYKYAKENHDIKKIIEEDKKILKELYKKP